jgi:rhodanese-related sulfurtransferase
MPSPTLPAPEAGFEIEVEDVQALSSAIADGSIQLIDCREQDEWDLNHLPNARFVPLSNFTIAAEPIIEKGKPSIVYCHHGMRSLRATAWLRSRGLQQAWSMKGGIDLWSDRIDSNVPKY